MLAIEPERRITMTQVLLGLPEGLARHEFVDYDVIQNNGLFGGGTDALLFGYLDHWSNG